MTYVESLLVLCLLIAGVAAAQPISTTVDAGRGAVQVYYPSTYDGSEALPLIVGLHGFTGSGAGLESYFDLITQIEDQQFVYAFPDGSRNIFGRFWNATDACCGSGVDDSGYLRGLVELIQRDFNIDSQSIHFTGHSNGGFMSHRMAIDHADMVASIASLAGANFLDAAAYQPSEAVHVLQVHGTDDAIIQYDGGVAFAEYPGAEQTMLNWVGYNALSPDAVQTGEEFNLDGSVGGQETSVTIFDPDNARDIRLELWTLDGSGHSPAFGNNANNRFAPRVVEWLLSHRKPFAGAICDFDQSGLCDLADIDAMHEIGPISDGIPVDSATESFDLNGDGQINLEDRDIWLLEAATANGLESEYILGDANLDGVVDVSDFNQWNANRFASSLLWSDGNFNGDSRIDVTDFNIWNSNKFRSSNPMVVPEPHSLVMIALGLFFGTFFRKQHHNV